MKKFLLLPVISISAIAFAQIPTTGLTDHWKLNGNLQNDIAARPFLRNEGFQTCQNTSGTYTAVIRHADTTNFVADRNGTASTAYHARTKTGPDSVFCNQVPPNGIWLKGPAATGLETSSQYQFQNTERTFALWAKANTLTSAHRLFFTGDQVAKKAFGLDIKPNANSVTLFTWGGGANDIDATVNNQDTLWHHYAATYDGAKLKLYIDGAIVDSSALTGLNTSISLIYFGNNTYQRDLYVDEILLYSRALSATEVAQVVAGTQSSIADFNMDKSKVKLYPNPTTDVLNITCDDAIQTIQVMDLTGRIVIAQTNLSTLSTHISTDHLTPSNYLIRLTTTSGETIVRNLIKQ